MSAKAAAIIMPSSHSPGYMAVSPQNAASISVENDDQPFVAAARPGHRSLTFLPRDRTASGLLHDLRIGRLCRPVVDPSYSAKEVLNLRIGGTPPPAMPSLAMSAWRKELATTPLSTGPKPM